MPPETVSDYENNYITGWIKLYRSIEKHWIFENEKYLKAWIIMLLKVNFIDKKILIGGELIECKRGQSVYSLDTWVKKFGRNWSLQNVRTFFKLLQNDEMINLDGLRKTTRLTIIEYDAYQGDLTDSQQTANTQLTSTKELKKERTVFIVPTFNDVESYCKEKDYTIDIEYFINFYESKNWMVGKSKMKNWKAAVSNSRKWDINNNGNKGLDFI